MAHDSLVTLKKLIKSKSGKEILRNYNTDMLQIVCTAILLVFALIPLAATILAYKIGVIDVGELMMGYYDMYLSFIPLVMVLFFMNSTILFIKEKKELISGHLLPWIILIVWILICTIVNGNYERLYIGKFVDETSITYGNSFLLYFVYFIVCFFTASMIFKEKARKLIIVAFFIVADILFLIVIAYQTGVIPKTNLPSHVIGQYSSVFGNKNHSAYFQTIVILLSGTLLTFKPFKISSLFYLFTFILNTAVLSLNHTFGCFLASLGGLLFLIIMRAVIDRRLSFLSVGVLVLFILVSMIVNAVTGGVTENFLQLFLDLFHIFSGSEEADAAGTNRWGLWKTVFGYMQEQPRSFVFGFGIEGYSLRLLSDGGYAKVHNEFIEIVSFFGIPGLVLYLTGLMKVFFHGLRHKNDLTPGMVAALAAAFGYLFSSFFGVSMFYTSPFLFIVLGLGYTTPQEGTILRHKIDGTTDDTNK